MKRLIAFVLATLLSLSLFFPPSAFATTVEIETSDKALEGELGCYIDRKSGRPLVFVYLDSPPEVVNPVDPDASLIYTKSIEFIRASLTLRQFGNTALDSVKFFVYKPNLGPANRVGENPVYRVFEGESFINGTLLYSTFEAAIPFRKGFYGLGVLFIGSKPVPTTLVYAELMGLSVYYDFVSSSFHAPSRIVKKDSASELPPSTACTNLDWDEMKFLANSAWLRRKVQTVIDLDIPLRFPIPVPLFRPAIKNGPIPNVPQMAPLRIK